MMLEQMSIFTKVEAQNKLEQRYQTDVVKGILDACAKELTSILETTYFKPKEQTLVQPINNPKLLNQVEKDKKNRILLKQKKNYLASKLTQSQGNLTKIEFVSLAEDNYFFDTKFKEIFQKLDHQKQIVNPLKLVINQNIDVDNLEVLFYVLSDQMRRTGRLFHKSLQSDENLMQSFQRQFSMNQADLQSYSITLQETPDLVFENIAFDEQLKQDFISKFKRSLSLDLKIEEHQINIIALEKGSIKVIFEVKDSSGNLHESQNLNELQRQFQNTRPQMKLHEYFKEAALSVNDFAPQYNKTWDNISFGTVRNRGPRGRTLAYFCPVGWKGYGLNISGMYGNNNNWLMNNNNLEEWYTLFHGSHFHALQGIMSNQKQLKPGPAQAYSNNECLITKQKIKEGVYLSNHIEVCESYSRSRGNSATSIGDNKFLLAVQARIKPDSLRQCPKSSDLSSLRNEYIKNNRNYDKSLDDMKLWDNDYFVVNQPCDIRIYRVLLKKK